MISKETIQKLFNDSDYRRRWLEFTRMTSPILERSISYGMTSGKDAMAVLEVAVICMSQDRQEKSSIEEDKIVDSIQEEPKNGGA